jgi:tetratricopeptide (TPR) repeat protein
MRLLGYRLGRNALSLGLLCYTLSGTAWAQQTAAAPAEEPTKKAPESAAEEPARQPETPPGEAKTPADDTERARTHFDRGVALYDQEKYAEAAEAFQATYDLKPHPAVLLNLAHSQLLAQRYEPAANNFALYLRQVPDSPAQQAVEGFAEAKKKVLELAITVGEAGANVSVDK